MPKYFDVHSHLNFPDYDKDREEVIDRLIQSSTHTITIGTNIETSKQAVALAERYEGIYASIGVHPSDDPNQSFDHKLFEQLVESQKVVAVGECGLDFFRIDREQDYERQKDLFINQVLFAVRHDKPLMIHARDTYDDLFQILKPLKYKYGERLRGNVHFFTGDLETAENFFDLGFSVSFTGVITFARNYDEVIRRVPLDKILAETDAPYVAPIPFRGQRNEPIYVSEVVKKISELRDEDFELVRQALVQNALSMIG